MDEKYKIDGMQMKYLRSMCEVTKMHRWRNEGVRRRVDRRENMSDGVNRKVLQWFGHVERLSEERLAKRVHEFRWKEERMEAGIVRCVERRAIRGS